jgi:hypothetical protein
LETFDRSVELAGVRKTDKPDIRDKLRSIRSSFSSPGVGGNGLFILTVP